MCPAAHAVKADCDGERVVLGALFGDVAANDGGGEGAVGVVEGFEVGDGEGRFVIGELRGTLEVEKRK